VRALRTEDLVTAAVPETATLLAAARTLGRSGLAAVAVVADDSRVVGLFAQDDLLRGLFPAYLEELWHTAFLTDDVDALVRRAREVGGEPVTDHMCEAVTVEADASATHIAERFLHSEHGALAVVEHDRFVGMLGQAAFCELLLDAVDQPGS
jgi:CBS domain-containing protein